jgi:hypothetical protein
LTSLIDVTITNNVSLIFFLQAPLPLSQEARQDFQSTAKAHQITSNNNNLESLNYIYFLVDQICDYFDLFYLDQQLLHNSTDIKDVAAAYTLLPLPILSTKLGQRL